MSLEIHYIYKEFKKNTCLFADNLHIMNEWANEPDPQILTCRYQDQAAKILKYH